jgi:hypothetical protein
MSTLAGEFWVCGECRSINNAGAKQCYNCRTPKDRAAVDPAEIDPTSHGRAREIELPAFRPSRGVALLASILIVAIAGMQVYNSLIATSLINQTLDGIPPDEGQLTFVGSVAILTLGIGALALISWSLWLSRAVTSMPALGLGYPAADGFMAFVENFLPGFNLFRVPAIVRDVVHRLEPRSGRGEALIFAAWIGLLGGFLFPRIAGIVLGITSDSPESTLRSFILVDAIATGFVVVGAIFLVALIWWVEGRIARRRAAQLADETPPPEAPTASPTVQAQVGAPTIAPQVEPDVVSTRSAFAVAGSTSVAPPPSDPPPLSPPPFALPRVTTDPAPAQPREPTIEPGPAPAAEPDAEPVVDREPEQVTAAAPPAEPEPVMAAAPEPIVDAQAVPTVEPITEPQPDEVAASPASVDGPPHLTIRVTTRGMITAEMDGETEHVILDDLEAYGSALAKVGGTATIVVTTDDSMAGLIARRAQRILDDAGVQVTVG